MYRAFFLTIVLGILATGSVSGVGKDPLEEKILGKTVGEWIKILRTHEEPRFRKAALIALESSNTAHKSGLPALLDCVEKDKDKDVRQNAVTLLGRLGPETKGAMKALAASLQSDKAGEVREAAATVIGNKFTKQAEDYLNVLADALKDPHVGTRIAAAGALRNMGVNAKPAFGVLFESAKNEKEDPLVRAAAVHVVSRHAKDDPKTLPLLLDLFKASDTPAPLREAAIDGLGRSGSDAPEVIAALAQAVAGKNVELRKASAVALGSLGVKAKAAWPTIRERLEYKVENDRAVPTESDSTVRNTLTRLTGVLAKTSDDAIPVLTNVAKFDDSTENRLAAIQELGELPALPKDTMDALRRIAVDDARASIREAAAKALKKN